MIKRNEKQPLSAKRTSSTKRFTTYGLILVSTLTLASGFFFAATQHFSSMDYGMKNSRLRKQIDQLEAEKRRLLLAKEVSMSPNEIKKAAKKAGLFDPMADPALSQTAEPVQAKAVPAPSKNDQPLIVKTASVAATAKPITTSFNKSDKTGKEAKRNVSTE
ncbi:MAG TPA: hypothetical protein PLP21_18655 [Pyrinomonadaceae bacterium]|nr:hypothetical protein [Acidobacteriota bacterium]HQZ98346.1 hypothetical protein [Pyrinomonadaceae bacterium]